jgi:asparagine synthase (glutamine-hydrolysing)
MCGICGILSFDKKPIEENVLQRMTDVLIHRGPDDEGTYVNPNKNVGFGFRRLSIVDLSIAGHQPMSNHDETIWIVFNGEIYNHLEVRKELEKLGYKYKSRSDTETLIYAYEKYGIDFVHKIHGMYAIAIWDERKKIFVAYRDRIGKKPFYYTFQNGRFIFASEIKSILLHPKVEKELDKESLNQYLTFLVPPAPKTMFNKIKKLPPAHRMIINESGDVKIEKYWEVINQDSEILENDEEVVQKKIIDMLRQSIKDRMMSDVPFGVFLSGGIDSSINVALMAELMDRPVDTFSVGFKDLEKYNEMYYARKVAQLFKTNHKEIFIDSKDALDFFPKLVYHQDEPLADPVCIPLYFVSKLARDNGTIVIQVGEGSDEQFAGYEWMKRDLNYANGIFKWIKNSPLFVQTPLYRIFSNYWIKNKQLLALDYLRRAIEGQQLFWGGAVNFTNEHKKFLYSGEPQYSDSYETVEGFYREYDKISQIDDTLRKMIFLEFKNRLPELLLMRVDKMSMATSVESRVPFLDYRLVEYSFKLSSKLKINNGVTKYILKKSVEGILPREIIYRKKQGFAAPMNEWLRGDLADFTKEKLLNSKIHSLNIFNLDYIQDLYKSHKSHRYDFGQNIWNLLNLFLWYDYWFEAKEI